jgi:rhodanese-related sulfurtransferase
MKNEVFFIYFFLIIGYSSFSQSDSIKQIQNINATLFNHYINVLPNAVIIDTRYWQNFKKKRIPNAFLAENQLELKSLTDSLDIDQPLFIYGDYPERDYSVAELLINKGFKSIFVLNGGFKEYIKMQFFIDKKRLKR